MKEKKKLIQNFWKFFWGVWGEEILLGLNLKQSNKIGSTFLVAPEAHCSVYDPSQYNNNNTSPAFIGFEEIQI